MRMVYIPIPYYSINQLQVTVAQSQKRAAGAIITLQVVFPAQVLPAMVLSLNSTNIQAAVLGTLSTTG